ncbi:MAG: sporulation protein YabP [Christensenellales bacterium]|jgi:sporulation protein YabP
MQDTEVRVAAKPHTLSLEDRQRLNLRGVLEVDVFNDSEVVLLTEGGYLSIDGTDLHIRKLDLESGHMVIEGLVHAMTYADDSHAETSGGGFFSRIFR